MSSKKRERTSDESLKIRSKATDKKVVTERKVVKATRQPRVPVLERAPHEGSERKRRTSPVKSSSSKTKTTRTKEKKSSDEEGNFREDMPKIYVKHPQEDKEDLDVVEKLRLLFLG
jgi:hypothetical protein